MKKKKYVFCLICGECLGEEKPCYAKKHLAEFPTHTRFLTKTIIDPLRLPNPDEWFKKLALKSTEILHREDSTDDFTMPQITLA